MTGVVLQYLSAWALLLLGLLCVVQLQRMKNEERVLSQVFPESRRLHDAGTALIGAGRVLASGSNLTLGVLRCVSLWGCW